jgi:hypothetical protein
MEQAVVLAPGAKPQNLRKAIEQKASTGKYQEFLALLKRQNITGVKISADENFIVYPECRRLDVKAVADKAKLNLYICYDSDQPQGRRRKLI